MPSIIKSNTAAFLAANQESRAKFLQEVRLKLDQEQEYFRSKIKSEQMSFPRGGPATLQGTRVQSGKLRRDWFGNSLIIGQSVKALVWSTTPYAPLHENGGTWMVPAHQVSAHTRRSKRGKTYAVGPYTVRSHVSGMVKRLRIGEAWDKTFRPNMQKEIDKAAATYLR